MKTLIIFGAGGHGKVVADTAREVARWDRIVFVDARYPELDSCGQWPVIAHDMQSLVENFKGADFVVAIGNNSLRLRLLQESSLLGFEQVNIIHPSSYISPTSQLGLGSVVFASAVVNIDAKLGKGCIVNTGATIDHDCKIGNGVHISPGANLAGEVSVGKCTWIGIGSSVKQQVSIGDAVVVGAGATVIHDVESNITVVGTPAKELKQLSKR